MLVIQSRTTGGGRTRSAACPAIGAQILTVVAGDPFSEEALPLGVGERDAVQRLELNPQVVDQEFFALTGRYSSACSCNRAMTARSRSASDW